MKPRAYTILCGLTLIVAILNIVNFERPGYTDAYYYYNAAVNLAEGDGLTDDYLWNYVNAPDDIPTGSHRYWMPLSSIVAAIPMAVLGTDFRIAQLGYIPFLMLLACIGMWLSYSMEEKNRHGWVGGLCVLIGGFFLPFWLMTDTFTLFAVFGAGALILMGRARDWRDLAGVGVLSALAHLTRADGLLLLMIGVWVVLISGRSLAEKTRFWIALLVSYGLVMLPWFLRNMAEFGAPLPSGGIGTAFLQEYNQIFRYPAQWSLSEFLDWGAGNILQSRLDALVFGFQTWLAVESLIVLAPFAAWALWNRRRDAFWAPFIWYAIGLHVAMLLVFTFPGTRGGLFHSSSALLPFWVALGLVGLDAGIARLAKIRRWRTREAQTVLGSFVIIIPLMIGVWRWQPAITDWNIDSRFPAYVADLPPEGRLMVNDPAEWYYHTGMGGFTLPDASLDVAYEIAQRYCIQYLIIDINVTESFKPLLEDDPQLPPYLQALPDLGYEEIRRYAFDVSCTP